MIKVVIIDDEAHAIKQLEKQLIAMDSIEIVKTFINSNEAVTELPQLQFDILFLDIEMPILNGFELLKAFEKHPFTVIFTTAFSQYAIEAFKYSAFDYLLKPIAKIDLIQCICRWQNSYQLKNTTEQINYLDALLDNPKQANKLTICTKVGYLFINIKDIIYCESESNYTLFHLHENKKVIASRTLKEYEIILENHQFLRVHKSYLVNTEKIVKLNKGSNYTIEMDSGIQLPIARNKQNVVKIELQL